MSVTITGHSEGATLFGVRRPDYNFSEIKHRRRFGFFDPRPQKKSGSRNPICSERVVLVEEESKAPPLFYLTKVTVEGGALQIRRGTPKRRRIEIGKTPSHQRTRQWAKL